MNALFELTVSTSFVAIQFHFYVQPRKIGVMYFSSYSFGLLTVIIRSRNL